jgi:hypothetical protein
MRSSAVLVTSLLFGGGACSSQTTASTKAAAAATTATTVSVAANEDGCVSMEEYDALRNGMSFNDALTILGGNGQELSSSDLGGIRTSMYAWDGCGAFGANMNAMFQSGQLVSKAQFGLRATGQTPILPTTTTTTTTPAQAAAAARAEAARQAEEKARVTMGGCRFKLSGGSELVARTSQSDCTDPNGVYHGKFKAGQTDAQIDAENDAIVNGPLVTCHWPEVAGYQGPDTRVGRDFCVDAGGTPR